MRSVIQQSVVLAASPEELYATYLDAKKHAAVTGSAVTISDKPGSKFSAFYGSITGTTLAVVPRRLIVQAWRSTNFGPRDPDSTLILEFVPHGKKGRINLVQIDVPGTDFRGVSDGWELYYWAPWRRYLNKPAPPARHKNVARTTPKRAKPAR
jgi:activator of HSP90 ATPase